MGVFKIKTMKWLTGILAIIFALAGLYGLFWVNTGDSWLNMCLIVLSLLLLGIPFWLEHKHKNRLFNLLDKNNGDLSEYTNRFSCIERVLNSLKDKDNENKLFQDLNLESVKEIMKDFEANNDFQKSGYFEKLMDSFIKLGEMRTDRLIKLVDKICERDTQILEKILEERAQIIRALSGGKSDSDFC